MPCIQDLPHPIVYEIASYVHDDVSMCHFAATCRDAYHSVVRLDQQQQNHGANATCSDLWKGRHERRWQNRSASTTKQEYLRRVWIDKQTVITLEELAAAAIASPRNQDETDDDDDDDEEEEDAAYNKRSILMQRRYALDACWTASREHADANVRNVAFSFLYPLQMLSAAEELVYVLNKTYSNTQTMLEEYAIMTSKVFTVLDAPLNQTDCYVRQELDRLADLVGAKLHAQRLDDSNDNNMQYSPREKIQAISKIFFQDLRFQVGGHRLEHHTLFFALHERIGTPLVLAILFKCLCHRLGGDGGGVQVDIVRNQQEPWTMVRVACSGLYINLYQNGTLLTESQLQDFMEAQQPQQQNQHYQQHSYANRRIMPLVSLSAMDVAQCLADDVAMFDDTTTNATATTSDASSSTDANSNLQSNTMLCGIYTARAVLQNPTTMTVDAAELDFCKYGFD